MIVFRKFLIADFISIMMSGSLVIFLYWYAYSFSLNQGVVAVIGVGQLFGVLLATVGGGMADSFNKVKLIQVLYLVRLLILFIVAVLLNQIKVELLLGFFMLSMTVCNNLLSPTLESLLPQLASNDEELYQFNSTVSALTQLSGVLAVLLSAAYIAFLDLKSVVYVSILMTTVSYFFIAKVRMDISTETGSTLSNIKKAVSYILSTRYIANLIPISLIMNFCFWSVFLILPKLSVDSFNFFKTSYSFFELSFSIGGMIAGLLSAKYVYHIKNKYRLFLLTLCFQSLMLISMGCSLVLFRETIAYYIGIVLWGGYAFFNTILSIVYFSSLQIKIPEHIIGSVIGTILTIFSFTNPLAALISPLLVESVSISIQNLSFGMVMFLMTVATYLFIDIKEAFG